MPAGGKQAAAQLHSLGCVGHQQLALLGDHIAHVVGQAAAARRKGAMCEAAKPASNRCWRCWPGQFVQQRAPLLVLPLPHRAGAAGGRHSLGKGDVGAALKHVNLHRLAQPAGRCAGSFLALCFLRSRIGKCPAGQPLLSALEPSRDLQLQHARRAGSPAHLRSRAAQEAPPATPPTMTTLAGVWVAIARTPSAVGLATTLDRWPSINLALLQPRCVKAGLGGAGNALRRMGESGAGGRV